MNWKYRDYLTCGICGWRKIRALKRLDQSKIFYTIKSSFLTRSVLSSYRQIVLRALPNLQKLDNIDVTPEELAEAMQNVSLVEEDSFEDTYTAQQTPRSASPPPSAATQSSHQNNQQLNHQQHPVNYSQQQIPPQQQQQQHHQQWRQSSPIREVSIRDSERSLDLRSLKKILLRNCIYQIF